MNFYTTGGTLGLNDLSYVERRADQELYEGLSHGEFCYVLTPRQMGKSSLMVRTAARLKEEGARVVVLDLTAVGRNMTAEQWYGGLLVAVGRQLDLEDELEAFWQSHRHVGPLQRFMLALEETVLPAPGAGGRTQSSCADARAPMAGQPRPPRMVIFIDEIDAVRSLPFSTDEFFAAIRECYNRRPRDPAFEQLTFCLLGVASPTDLIRDTRLTPFNIGRRIELTDFSEEEAGPLAVGLELGTLESPGRSRRQARALLERILYWTGGQPYLTQRLCQAVAGSQNGGVGGSGNGSLGSGSPIPPPSHSPIPCVDRACAALFLTKSAREKDDNLIFVRERLLRSEVDRAALLDLYRQVLRGKRVRDDDSDPLHAVLKLAGVVRADGGYLRVRNRIYDRVFGRDWVATQMPDAELRRQRAAFRRGALRAAGVAGVMVAVVAGLGVVALRNQRLAEERLVRMEVASGVRLLDEGDLFGALPWFVEALRREQADPARAEMHRTRIAAVLAQCPRLAQLSFNGGGFGSFAEFSRDGRFVVTAGVDGTARVWEVATGRPVAPPLGHHGQVLSSAFSADGRQVVTASKDATARVWDAATGAPLTPPLRHPGAVGVAEFSPDGRLVATAGVDDAARLWQVATGRLVTPPLRHRGGLVTKVTFSPDGRRVLTAVGSLRDDRARVGAAVWDARTGRQLRTLIRSKSEVVEARYSPDGRWIVTAQPGGSYLGAVARIWDAATLLPVGAPLQPSGITFQSARFSPDGRRLLMLTDSRAQVWDLASGQAVAPAMQHRGGLTDAQFDGSGGRVATAGRDGTVRVWDAATGEPVCPFVHHGSGVSRARFGPDGHRLLTACYDATTRVWELAGSGSLELDLAKPSPLLAISLTADGSRLLAGRWPGARIYDATSGSPLTPAMLLDAATQWLSFSPDGRRAVTTTWTGAMRIWDGLTGQPLTPLLPARGNGSVTFSQDGRLVAIPDPETLHVCDAVSGQILAEIPRGDPGGVSRIFPSPLSPDGRRVLTEGPDFSARMWDAATGRPLPPRFKHAFLIQSAQFSPDGRRVLTGSRDWTARIWDARTGRPIGLAMHHGEAVIDARFSPDGRRVLTGSVDASARIWDAATGEPLTAPMMHSGEVTAVAWSADGRRALTVAAEGARLWDGDLGEPLTPVLGRGTGAQCASLNRDGRRVAVGGLGVAQVWNLPADPRPVSELLALVQLLSSHQVNATDSLAPVAIEDLRRAWRQLRPRYPATFSASPAEIDAWHQREAARAAAAGQWSISRDHLEQRLLGGEVSGPYAEYLAKRLRYRLALARLVTGDAPGYRQEWARIWRRFGASRDDVLGIDLAQTAAVRPDALADWSGPLRRVRQIMHREGEASYTGLYGSLLYRAGRPREAARWLERGTHSPLERGTGTANSVYVFLAMAQHALGQRARAEQSLAQGARIIEGIGGSLTPWERLELQTLRREAEGVILAGGKNHGP